MAPGSRCPIARSPQVTCAATSSGQFAHSNDIGLGQGNGFAQALAPPQGLNHWEQRIQHGAIARFGTAQYRDGIGGSGKGVAQILVLTQGGCRAEQANAEKRTRGAAYDHCNLQPLDTGKLSRELKVEPVAGVVFHDQQDPGRACHRADGGQHGISRGRGEDLTADRRRQHMACGRNDPGRHSSQAQHVNPP